jgi:AcrR family transcriptional regulator
MGLPTRSEQVATMQARASRTRSTLLQAAAETFSDRGYAASSLQDIADRQAVSKGALYFHFPSKKALALAVIGEHEERWRRLVEELRPKHPRAIRLLLELSWEMARRSRHDVLTRAAIRLQLERNLISPAVPRPFVGWIPQVAELLRETREQGDLLPGLDPDDIARFIVAAFSGFQQLADSANRNDPSQCVNSMWRYALPSLVDKKCLIEIEPLVHASA